jgi:hypothetical protein
MEGRPRAVIIDRPANVGPELSGFDLRRGSLSSDARSTIARHFRFSKERVKFDDEDHGF